MNSIAHTIFEQPAFAQLQASARYLLSLAARAGISLSYEDRAFRFEGAAEQVKRSGMLGPDVDMDFKRKGWRYTGLGATAMIHRVGQSDQVVGLFNAREFRNSKSNRAKVLDRAAGDTGWLKFR